MEKALRPSTLALDPKASADGRNRIGYTHWKATFEQFLEAVKPSTSDLSDEKKFSLLINHITPEIYNIVAPDLKSYKGSIKILDSIYIKTRNTSHARYVLATRRQKDGETVGQYSMALNAIAADCDFKAVTIVQHSEESIMTALIAGLKSDEIRKRLLENTTTLDDCLKIAESMEEATKNSKVYHDFHSQAGFNVTNSITEDYVASMNKGSQCSYCGRESHPRNRCPARNSRCSHCKKPGHWVQVCRIRGKPEREGSKGKVNAIPAVSHLSNPMNPSAAMFQTEDIESFPETFHNSAMPTYGSFLASTHHRTPSTYPSSLGDAVINIKVNSNLDAFALIDTGSTLSFISKSYTEYYKLPVEHCERVITMASESHSSKTLGACRANLISGDINFGQVKLLVLERPCCDIILGHDLLAQHSRVSIRFNGNKPPLEIVASSRQIVAAAMPPLAKIEPVSLFSNLTPDIRPIACSSRKFSEPAAKVIRETVSNLKAGGIIRPSKSPWRAQVLVANLDGPKPRMVVDYSRTINKFTELDAYPLPNIESMISQLAQYTIFSTFDLRSAYHQVPILESEKSYTAFEADGGLWESNVVPFGPKNGPPAFQRVVDRIISDESLTATYAYLDNLTVGGHSQEDHDRNAAGFLKAFAKYGLTLNEDKTISSVTSLKILGYLVSKGSIKPDPDRMGPLLDLPVPHDKKSLQRALGLFSYYSRWVEQYSDRVNPLVSDPEFPLSQRCRDAFQDIKTQIANSCVICPNTTETLVLESDASDIALSASLNQGGKPVAFFSRTLKSHERKHSSVEKEAAAIVEACRKWTHYLVGRHFLLITDQQAVSFMFDQKHLGKVKNDKILRWRVELSALDFDIKYRPGPENVTADCLSRANCSASSSRRSLEQIHRDLAHPGVVRLHHFTRSRNLPYTMEEVRTVCKQCRVCAEIKPQFYRPKNPPLIEATKPFDRIAIDFKGPIPSATQNHYLLVAVDEYSRFCWAQPCRDMESSTVITFLESQVYSLAGTSGFIHSDRGSSLISQELRTWLIKNGVAFSNSSRYNPRGNGQVERFNGIVWRSVELALRDLNLPKSHWESVLTRALHSQRSLLCTATNATPHERMFTFPRRAGTGDSLPTWLIEKGPILLRQHARRSKYLPIVKEVELVSANPSFAKIRHPCGREDNVSLRDLAPCPRDIEDETPQYDNESPPGDPVNVEEPATVFEDPPSPPVPLWRQPEKSDHSAAPPSSPTVSVPSADPPIRRSTRQNFGKPPDRFEAGA